MSDGNNGTNKEVFISLTDADSGIATAIRAAFKSLFGDEIKVFNSSSQELETGIRHGDDWFDWIVTRIRNCDFALFLITPLSVHKPWILWEVGVAYGIALSTGKGGIRKIRPIIYQINDDKIPTPIKDLRIQFKRGDKLSDVKSLFKEIVDEYRSLLTSDKLSEIGRLLDTSANEYLKQVAISLTKAPLFEMADRYLNINASDWRERVKQKNKTAIEMGKYMLTNRIVKNELVRYDSGGNLNEGLLVGVAEAISMSPQEGDLEFLLSIARNVERYHVKFKIMVAVATLFEHCNVSKDVAQNCEGLLQAYEATADDQLLNRIERNEKYHGYLSLKAS